MVTPKREGVSSLEMPESMRPPLWQLKRKDAARVQKGHSVPVRAAQSLIVRLSDRRGHIPLYPLAGSQNTYRHY